MQSGPTALKASLVRNFSWTGAGAILVAALQWGMLAIIAKTGGAELVGLFTLATAITTPVFSFFNLHLRALQSTDASQQFTFLEYFTLRNVTSFIGVVAVFSFASIYLRAEGIIFLICAMSVRRLVDSMSDIVYGYFQQRERLDLQYKSMVFNAFLGCALLGGVLYYTQDLGLAVGVTVVSSIVAFWFTAYIPLRHMDSAVAASISILSRNGKGVNWNRLWSLAVLAFPLGVVVLFNTLNTSAPRIIVEHFLGAQKLGIYSGLVYVTAAVLTITTALGQSAGPSLSRFYRDNQRQRFMKLVQILVVIGFVMGVVGAIFVSLLGEPLLRIIYTEEYVGYSYEFTMINLAMAPGYAAAFMFSALTAIRALRWQLWIYVAAFSANIAITWIMVPRYGISGAVWGLAVSNLVQMCLASVVLHMAWKSSDDCGSEVALK